MDHSKLTFSQRHGLLPIPQRLKSRELSPSARNAIWNVLCRNASIDSGDLVFQIGQRPWFHILLSLHEDLFHGRIDQFRPEEMWRRLDSLIAKGRYNDVFDVIEAMLRHRDCPRKLAYSMANCFEKSHLAYFLSLENVPTVMPACTEKAATAITQALRDVHQAGLSAAIRHLEMASERINGNDHAGAIRESIHAVESVARSLDPGASTTLAPALSALENRRSLHPAFKKALSQLYGYTSDEQGIRHALIDKQSPDVGPDEATFMFGACAVFCGYLARRGAAPRRTGGAPTSRRRAAAQRDVAG